MLNILQAWMLPQATIKSHLIRTAEKKQHLHFITKSTSTRLPFGLCNGPLSFQEIMEKIFQKELGVFIHCYLDDMIIFSKTEEEHKRHIKIVLSKIKEQDYI